MKSGLPGVVLVSGLTLAGAHGPGASGARSDRVIVEALVLARDGTAAPRLQARDFTVTLDGVQYPVVNARVVPRRPRVLVIIVDEPNIASSASSRVRDAVRQLARQALGGHEPPPEIAIVRWPELTVRTIGPSEVDRISGQIRGRADEPSELLPLGVDSDMCTTDACRRALAQVGSDYAREITVVRQAIVVRKALWTHGQTALDGLRRMLGKIASIQGQKEIFWFTTGILLDVHEPALEALKDAAGAARATIYPVEVSGGDWLHAYYNATDLDTFMRTAPDDPTGSLSSAAISNGREGLSQIAALSAGTVLLLGSEPAVVVRSFQDRHATLYALDLERAVDDSNPTTRSLRVIAPARDVKVVVRARWDPRADITDLVGAPSAGPRRVERTTDAALDAILAKAAGYVADFEQKFSALVAEERLEQIARIRDARVGYTYVRRRLTRADMLLVQDPHGEGLVTFRDVFEVDGHAVTDRSDRLQRLFLDRSAAATSQAQAITAASAQFNIGAIRRNFNVPTFPLLFLKSDNRSRFSFKNEGHEVRAGALTYRIRFEERARPTFIQGVLGNNVPVSGTFWIAPETGAVVSTHLQVFEVKLRVNVDVVYQEYSDGESPTLWVPVQMLEDYANTDDGQSVQATATYSNLRRFTVTTAEFVK